ncbi:MAG: cation transporter [Candidatus Aminicenantes bacterium]|nr:cation transporter [Candidatus Aminicenantes bacterium]
MSKNERLNEALHVTKVGIFANLFLVVLKFAAGFWGRSSAVIADAVHSLSDFVSDIAVIAGLKLAEKPPDQDHKYGHGKFETLSAIFLSIILIFTGVGLFLAGGDRILKYLGGAALEKPGWIAVFAAFISILVKEFLYHYTVRIGRKIDSRSVIANAIHHRSDAISSVGALLGVGGAVILGENWRVLDPLASIIVSFFIIKVSLKIMKKSMDEMLEAALEKEVEDEILALAEGTAGVINPHNLRTRRIGSNIGVDLHIEVDGTLNIRDAHEISHTVEKKLLEKFDNRAFITIHVDPEEIKKSSG